MPRDTLTRDQIVGAAVELMDAEGLEGLNMRALGKRLGAAATAMYWHVKSKDNLVVLATDRVWGELALPEPDGTGWRGAAVAMAADLHAMFTRHPWLVQVLAAHPVYGHGKARHDDHHLALYEKAGFTPEQADQATAAVFTYVLGNAAGIAATAALTRRLAGASATARQQFEEAMAKSQEIAKNYPRLRARLESPAASDYSAAPDNTFETGLHALLDGLEHQLTR